MENRPASADECGESCLMCGKCAERLTVKDNRGYWVKGCAEVACDVDLLVLRSRAARHGAAGGL